jgi:hypothetical protein
MNFPDLPALAEPELHARAQHALDHKTKPLGALGRIEALALQLALIQGVERPALHQPQLVVYAADHGLSRRGVSAYPREVTPQMVANMLAGGAAVSVLAASTRRWRRARWTCASPPARSTQAPARRCRWNRRNARCTKAWRWSSACRAMRCCWARWASATPRRPAC